MESGFNASGGVSVSAVPAFQILARGIGEARMKDYVEKIRYGSQDISAGIDIFWLPRPQTKSIEISADEQVFLLNMLLDGKLPFSEEKCRDTAWNYAGWENRKGTLYGKTGSGMGPDGNWNLGWFVGFLKVMGPLTC